MKMTFVFNFVSAKQCQIGQNSLPDSKEIFEMLATLFHKANVSQ
jgi:hypothetical protein